MWIYGLIGLVLVAMGLAVHVFKMYFLISGYNTMSVEKKANVDIAAVAKVMGITFYFDGAMLMMISILHYIGLEVSQLPFWIAIGISFVFMLIFVQRYDGNMFDEHHKLLKGALKKMFLPVSITFIAVVGVAILFVVLSRPIDVQINENDFKIGGMYGGTYNYDKVENIQYLTEIPEILVRTNGAAFGSHLRGYFKMEEYGAVTLFLNKDYKEYIYFEYGDKTILFNDESPRLRALFDQIQSNISEFKGK